MIIKGQDGLATKSDNKVLNDYLQILADKICYKKWYFGHHHMDVSLGAFVGVFESVLRLGE